MVRSRWPLFVLGVAVACGTELGPAQSISDGGSVATDAGGDAGREAEPEETRVDTFPCGTTLCIFGQHACCLSPSGPSCAEADASCPSQGDAGVSVTTAPPLRCGSYRNCQEEDETCCFFPDAGSSCTTGCSSKGGVRLCTLGQDNCGEDADCKAFAESPAPSTTGRCEKTGD